MAFRIQRRQDCGWRQIAQRAKQLYQWYITDSGIVDTNVEHLCRHLYAEFSIDYPDMYTRPVQLALYEQLQAMVKAKRNVPPSLTRFVALGVISHEALERARIEALALGGTVGWDPEPYKRLGLGRLSALGLYAHWWRSFEGPNGKPCCPEYIKDPAFCASPDLNFVGLYDAVVGASWHDISDMCHLANLAYVEAHIPGAWAKYLSQTKGEPGLLLPLTTKNLKTEQEKWKSSRDAADSLEQDASKNLPVILAPFAARMVLELTLEPICAVIQQFLKTTDLAIGPFNLRVAINRELASVAVEILVPLIATARRAFDILDNAEPPLPDEKSPMRASLMYCNVLNDTRESFYASLYYLTVLAEGMYGDWVVPGTDHRDRTLRDRILEIDGRVSAHTLRTYFDEILRQKRASLAIVSHKTLGLALIEWYRSSGKLAKWNEGLKDDKFLYRDELVEMLGTDRVRWSEIGSD